MQIMIDLPEEIIADAKTSPNFFPTYHFGTLWKAVRNGTPLSKGHGRLIDTDAIAMPILETEADEKWMRIAINSAPTIIEADTESEG